MFGDIENALQKVITGEIDKESVSQAADEQVNNTSHEDLKQQVETAANNASQSGNTNVASQLFTLVQQYEANPQGLKSEVISLISNNPQIIQHFAPEFAQRILSSV